MDFDFSDEQQQLREAVGKWVSKAYSFERRRAIADAGGFDRAAYAELADLGLTGLTIAEEHGGLGLGAAEAMVTLEELGRGLVLEPLAQTLIANAVLSTHGPAALQTQWLPPIAAGQALVVLAPQERKARYRLDLCQTQAQQEGADWFVTGTKHLVPVGDLADAFIVAAKVGGQLGGPSDGQIALFLVPRQSQGVITRGHACQDGSRAADLVLNHAPASLITLDGLAALELGVDVGLAAACAEGVGAMERSLAITVEYMNTRKQFGVLIASFQALRHRVADMKMQLELARSMSYYASLKLSAPANERRAAMARAKYQLGVSMRFIGQQAIQLHGGIAMTDEYIVSHYFKKLTQLELSFGDTAHQLGQVSQRMGETAGVFA